MLFAGVLLLLGATSVLSQTNYAPFQIHWLTTHQPNGNPAGQVNHYQIAFNITSANGNPAEEAYCWQSWGDNNNNCGNSCVAYSTAVPAGEWIICARDASDLGDRSSGFAFKLFPYFSIGNFSLAVRQNFTQESGPNIISQASFIVTNSSTSDFVCDINPQEVFLQQHAQGDCWTPDSSSGFTVPVAEATPACSHASTVSLSFPVTERTGPGDKVYVVGSIPELGNWDPSRAVELNTGSYNDMNTLWTGGRVSVLAGTTFEYKYVQKNADGSLLWECGENRVATVSSSTCGEQTIGNDPDYFRCGTH
ncbi:carbohydrate-binding module family 20 protein [Dissoconium aciculare CBS 342.82]|jgi:hypothetical protein|uniref:Carbohydrate-binding module family 20 protein n=1 Tax=Dissoconium aciculare CBS 342.82 TaxID=1314786 RepID=A0A6J3M9T1_9PEZI|nr:carbohydrate-binding module family 20 protein [Dissoconium aciculare CBS 342.82]KAF1824593.1 carbohydrate-binding module family 20 protein [Dissoconium aciculare CBS 342.82]